MRTVRVLLRVCVCVGEGQRLGEYELVTSSGPVLLSESAFHCKTRRGVTLRRTSSQSV